MISYRLSQALALLTSLFALLELFLPQANPSAHLRLALLLYSSLLIATVSTFAMKNLVGQARYARFGWFLLLTSVGIYLLFLSANTFLLGSGWTLSGAGAIALVNHADNHKSRGASAQMRTWFLVSDLSFWCALLLAHFHRFDLFSPTPSSLHSATLKSVIALLIVLSGVIRSGAFPAMRWLIATSEAPSPLSAFLHAGIVNGFGYLLIVFPILHQVRVPIAIIAITTITLALSIMRHRHDEKGKLANGTSMQMAFMALEGILGIPGIVLLHIIGHGSYKSWSFLRAGGAPLRKKNALTLPLQREISAALIALLTALFLLAVGIAATLLGKEYFLNLSVLAIALASSMIFICKLPKSLFLTSTLTTLFMFCAYLLILWSTSELFRRGETPSTSLVLTLSILMLLITGLLRVTPRTWTLRIATHLNGYSLARRALEVGQGKLQNSSLSPFDSGRAGEFVAAASSPFAQGMVLSRIVAQDSLVGLNDLEFAEATKIAAEYGISLYSSSTQYLAWLEQGVIDTEVLTRSLSVSHPDLTVGQLIAATTDQALALASEGESKPTPAEIEGVVSRANWWSAQSWYSGRVDASTGAYQIWWSTLPAKLQGRLAKEPLDALAQILPVLLSTQPEQTGDGAIIALLQRLISLDISWFLYAKGLGISAEESLLALRAALLLFSHQLPSAPAVTAPPYVEVWQAALEESYAEKLKSEMARSAATIRFKDCEYELSVVTCIDVRSDVLRMKAEESAKVRTAGMAGFFGVDLCLSNSNRGEVENFAPIILTPSLKVLDERRSRLLWSLPSLWKYASSGTGALAIAEGFGIFNGLLSVVNTFAPRFSRKINQPFEPSRWLDETGSDISFLSDAQKLQYATGILAIIFPQNSEITSEVVFVGHGAEASNTPFRSMYECGACGGNNGGLNARFAANLMNDAFVQAILQDRYPGQTIRFFAAEHNTTAGTFSIDPRQLHEASTQSSQTLRELALTLSVLPRRDFPTSTNLIESGINSSTAWWQVFPEWGLSGNAACIIGAREITRNLDLQSRVFLHDYSWEDDESGEILQSIFSGPGVVMQMINSAYNAAITSPQNFSSADKTRHNVLGEAGVLLGADGPLLRGLPWQGISPSPDLRAGESRGHIPIRLQIFVAAPQAIIDRALNGSGLAPLVHGGWVSLHPLTTVNDPLTAIHA